MNFALWIVAGFAAGWIGFALMRLNAGLGMQASCVIGMLVAFTAGELIAPMLSSSVVNPGDFNPLSLLTAFACSAGSLVILDMVLQAFQRLMRRRA